MDTSNDNPLKRFSNFWFGAFLFAVFGLAGLLLAGWFNEPVENGYDAANADRRETIKKEVQEAQAGAAAKAAAGFAKVGAELFAVNPAAVEDDKWLLPESDKALAKVAAGNTGIAVPEDFPRVADDAPVDEAVMAAGKAVFDTPPGCVTCHGAAAEGMDNLGPPLAGSEWASGPVENLIAIQLRGLTGPIEVKGKTYPGITPMPPQFFQTDEQIAAVLTYVRNSFGNKASPVTPEQVKALRGEQGKPMLTQADLVPPSTSPTLETPK
jgi:mono/diheme cytochrome c family protein